MIIVSCNDCKAEFRHKRMLDALLMMAHHLDVIHGQNYLQQITNYAKSQIANEAIIV